MNTKSIPSNHHITHQSPPMIWQDGFPVGNGFIGAMVWGGGHPLNFTLDCADLWDNRSDCKTVENPDYNYNNLIRLIKNKKHKEADKIFGTGVKKSGALYPTKISIGRAELDIGAVRDYICRLDPDRAVVEGCLKTKTLKHDFTAFVSKTRHVLCLRVTNLPKRARLKLRPLMEICPTMSALQYAPPEFVTRVLDTSGGSSGKERGKAHGTGVKSIRIMTQIIPDGLCYSVAWNITGAELFIAVETGNTTDEAANKASITLSDAMRIGFNNLYKEHVGAWRRFWNASAVVLPERDAEFYWYYGVYLLASSAKRGHLPPGLQGLWAMDGVLPPWRGDYHNDMNVQETFWPAGVSGHLDLLDCWCDYMLERMPSVQKYTRQIFGTEGVFWPCTLFGKASPGGAGGSPWYALTFSWSHGGWLGWLVWLRWRYGPDVNWLRETGYPLLSEIFKFFRANLVSEKDGYLHVPLSSSPEYFGHDATRAFCKDPNIDLALIRKCCDWIMEMEQALNIKKLSADARKIRAQLAPYALSDKKELCLWPGKLLDESHRHPSQLMAVHPAMDLTIDDDEETREIITAAINQYLSLGQFHWAGHTYAQMIGCAAVLGRGEWAYDCLRQFMDRWTMLNGLHVNADWRGTGVSYFGAMNDSQGRSLARAPFTMEANNAVSAGIGDMLVQGWRDKVRVFPALPAHWREAAFFNLMTEGGWKVSAVRHLGQTVWVSVTATIPQRLKLADPFDGAAADTGKTKRNIIAFKNGVYSAQLSAGETVVFTRKGYRFDRRRVIANIRAGNVSLLGLPPDH